MSILLTDIMEQDPNFFNLLESLIFVSENYARIAIEEGLSLHDISCHDLLHLLQSSWSSSSTPVFSVGLHRLILELRAQNKIHSHGDRGDLDIYLNKAGACSPFPPCFLLVRRPNTELEVLVPLNVEDSIDLDRCGCCIN